MIDHNRRKYGHEIQSGVRFQGSNFSKLLRSKVEKSVVLSPKFDTLSESTKSIIDHNRRKYGDEIQPGARFHVCNFSNAWKIARPYVR